MKTFRLKLNRGHKNTEHGTQRDPCLSDIYHTVSKVTTDGCQGFRDTTYLSSEKPWMHIVTTQNI